MAAASDPGSWFHLLAQQVGKGSSEDPEDRGIGLGDLVVDFQKALGHYQMH